MTGSAKKALSLVDNPEERYIFERFFPYLNLKLADDWDRVFQRTMKRHGISVPLWHVLCVIYAQPGVSLNEVAQLALIKQASASRNVEELVARGYVTRQAAEDDGRAVAIHVTEKGLEEFRRIWPLAHGVGEKRMSRLTEREQATLFRLFRKLLDDDSHADD